MFKIILNKSFICNYHTPLHEIGLTKIIPLLISGVNKNEVIKAIKFVREEYSEYFQILNEKTKIIKYQNTKLHQCNIDIIILKETQIILHKKLQKKPYLYTKNRNIEKDLIKICNELISTYRNYT